MQITIRPDPDCIELIRAEFKDMVIGFLKSVGIPAKDAENWETIHTVEIDENIPPLLDVFNMKCYLPDELFANPEWVFKFAREEFFTSFIISGHTVCFLPSNTAGLKYLPKNLLNLSCNNYQGEALNEYFHELKKLPSLKSISFKNCTKLKNISLLENFVNLQTLDLSYCDSLSDTRSLAGLLNLQRLDLSGCTSLRDISSLVELVNLQTLDLSGCTSLTDISSLAELVNLQTLDLSYCESLSDTRSLAGLLNLQRLDLSGCTSLTDISSLAELLNLQRLDLSGCTSLTDISSLAELVNLQKLALSGCTSLTDMSSLSVLINLQTLDLNFCKSITTISSLAGLLNLQRLDLIGCTSLTDISSLAKLANLQLLNLSGCESLTDIRSISGLHNLQRLNFRDCKSITDISSLAKLVNLHRLNFRNCKSITDISSLSGLINLQDLDFSGCEFLNDISSLYKLINLQTLNLEGCKRIKSYSPFKNCLALKDLKESNMHPLEFAELLCFLAVQRKDILFISNNAYSWLRELKQGFKQNYPLTNDLACSLAHGIVLANLEEESLSFHRTLLNYPDVSLAPWKIWALGILKNYGWDVFNYMAELSKPSELTFGAIGGISFCLPSLEGDPLQIAWSKKWISEIHSLYNNNPNFLKPAAAEWCLALKRLGEDELLREWIEKFTDPSDPSALDPINKVFSAYALDLNDSEFALEYALKVNDPKLRDESILNLTQQFIQEGETSKAGDFLFLLTQIESRTQLAYSLAEDAAYLKIDENAHRLLAACGDNPQSLASILDNLRLANPASEILKIMYEKVSYESRFSLSDEAIALEAVVVISKLSKVTDSTFLNDAKKAMETLLKNKPNYV